MPLQFVVDRLQLGRVPVNLRKWGKSGIHVPERLMLYEHQADLIRNWEAREATVLTAPTGAGKTASTVIPLVLNKENAIFVYPTNELVKNQAHSIRKILEDMLNQQVALHWGLTRQSDQKTPELETKRPDIFVMVATGETMRLTRERRRKGDILIGMLAGPLKRTFLLTNPDILYLILALRYSQKFRQLQVLQSFRTLVIDELHMYSGIELANLVYALKYGEELGLFKRKVFLTATPNPEQKRLLSQLFNPIFVEATKKLDGEPCTVLEKTTVELHIPREKSVSEDIYRVVKSHLEDIKAARSNESSPDFIPCVVILNSVIQAINLEDQLQEAGIVVTPYRGLMNKTERRLGDASVIVGTSSIEVGIDFDTQYLIMEAGDSASFIQRFGRISRHRAGKAVVLVPPNVYRMFAKYKCEYFTRPKFEELIQASYLHRQLYTEFVRSQWGILFAKLLSGRFLDELMAFHFKTPDDTLRRAEDVINKVITEICDTFDVELQTVKLLSCLPFSKALKDRLFFRSSVPSIPVFDLREKTKGRNPYYDVDLYMLLKRGDPCTGVRLPDGRRGVQINSYIKYHDVLFKSIRRPPPIGKLCVNEGDTTIYILRDGMSFPYAKELKGHVYIIVDEEIQKKLDWRIGLFRFDAGKTWIAFDGDALICRYYYEKIKLKNDKKRRGKREFTLRGYT